MFYKRFTFTLFTFSENCFKLWGILVYSPWLWVPRWRQHCKWDSHPGHSQFPGDGKCWVTLLRICTEMMNPGPLSEHSPRISLLTLSAVVRCCSELFQNCPPRPCPRFQQMEDNWGNFQHNLKTGTVHRDWTVLPQDPPAINYSPCCVVK